MLQGGGNLETHKDRPRRQQKLPIRASLDDQPLANFACPRNDSFLACNIRYNPRM